MEASCDSKEIKELRALGSQVIEVDLPAAPAVLVADDDEGNRTLLERRLRREGYRVFLCENGIEVLRLLKTVSIDLILLDIVMPGLDGVQVLERLKADESTKHVPVVMISAVDDLASVVHCLSLGADDYINKPFNSAVLRARVGALCERKQLRDTEQKQRLELERQRKISDDLLLNILPAKVADELRRNGFVAPSYFGDATIVFTDFSGFTRSTEQLPTQVVVSLLDRYFTAFDKIIERYRLEKLKTIGDSYMFAAGLPVKSRSHAVDAVLAALEIAAVVNEIAESGASLSWKIRIGVHTGPVAAGIVGLKKFAFDVWGSTVNLASRMESSGEAGRINLSARTYARVKHFFVTEKRGTIKTKDGQFHQMHFADGVKPALLIGNESGRTEFANLYRSFFDVDPIAIPVTTNVASVTADQMVEAAVAAR